MSEDSGGHNLVLEPEANDSAEGSRRVLNPWLFIWFKPRATIQQVVDEGASLRLFITFSLCVAILSIYLSLFYAIFCMRQDAIPSLLYLAFVPVSPLVLYVWAILLRWTGKRFGGKAKTVNILASVTLMQIPPMLCIALLNLAYFVHDNVLFLGAEAMNTDLAIALISAWAVLLLWGYIVSLKTLAQVQEFSVYKAFISELRAAPIIFIIVIGAIYVLV